MPISKIYNALQYWSVENKVLIPDFELLDLKWRFFEEAWTDSFEWDKKKRDFFLSYVGI